jgi:putative ubiquitin-RnfH superfamily antitoxin RatB of RatAB toxin-antitoxin module
MRIEVVVARREGAEIVPLDLPPGAKVSDALEACGLEGSASVGIFGRSVALDATLTDGDRLEIYRPLALDPKEARRRRARTPR